MTSPVGMTLEYVVRVVLVKHSQSSHVYHTDRMSAGVVSHLLVMTDVKAVVMMRMPCYSSVLNYNI